MDDKTRMRCNNCGSEFYEEYIECYLEIDYPESYWIGHCPVCWGIDIAAISAIDPDAIRAEARAEALREAAGRIYELAHDFSPCEYYSRMKIITALHSLAAILADEPKEREEEEQQVDDEDFHRQMLLAFQEIRRKRRDEGMSEWADGDMAAWVMDRLPALRSHQAEEIKLRAEVKRRIEEAKK